MKIEALIKQQLCGKTFSRKALTSQIENDPTTFKKAEIEARGIHDNDMTRKGRSLQEIINNSVYGLCGEMILRNDLVIGPLVKPSTKKYHDLWVDSISEHIEVKIWAKRNIEKNIHNFILKDRNYNTSKFLCIFTCEDDDISFYSILNLDTWIAPSLIKLKQTRNSFTMPYAIFKNLNGDEFVEFEFDSGRKLVKNANWFIANSRESKFGKSGGVYIFADSL